MIFRPHPWQTQSWSKALQGSLFPGVRCTCFLVKVMNVSCLENVCGSILNTCLMWRNSLESKWSLQIILSMTEIEHETLFLQGWKSCQCWVHEICFYLYISLYIHWDFNKFTSTYWMPTMYKALNLVYRELQRYTV